MHRPRLGGRHERYNRRYNKWYHEAINITALDYTSFHYFYWWGVSCTNNDNNDNNSGGRTWGIKWKWW